MSSAEKSKVEVLEEVQGDDWVESGTAYEISFKDHSDGSNQYPSMGGASGSLSLERVSQDEELEEVVNTGKRSSFALEDSVSSSNASFSCFNASFKEVDVMKSNLQQKLKETKDTKDTKEAKERKEQEQEGESEEVPSDKDMRMMNQSMFTSRLGKNTLPHRQSGSPEKEGTEAVNYNQSFYMTDKAPIAPPKQAKQQIEKRPPLLQVNFISKAYFLQLKQFSVEVTKSSMHDFYHELFKKQIFVPRFNYERLEEWLSLKDLNKYQPECDEFMNFKVYLERYVAYLNENCPENELEDVLQNVQLFQQGQKDKKTANEGFSLFNLDFNHLMENLKTMMNFSKYEALRKTLLWKMKSLKSMLLLKEVWKISLEQEKMVKLTIEGIWKDLADVELLRNFEETEEYCCKQIENSPELKFKEIWIKYRDGNRKAKNQFETSVDSICL